MAADKSKVRNTLHNIYFSKPASKQKAKEKSKIKPMAKTGKPAKPVPKKEKKGGFFHFGKKTEKPEQAKAPEIEKPDFVKMEDKNLEKRLEQLQSYLEKRMASIEQTISISRELFAELRRVNDALRLENKQLIDKLNTQSFDPNLPNWQEPDSEVAPEERQQKNNVKTQLDQLTDLIMEKGSIKIPEAAKKLKLKEKQIEEWAKMLEEHDLIEIHYPAFGKPILKKKT
jgi:hypothetical protein